MEREVTSIRANVRRIIPSTSRTNQLSWCFKMSSSTARTVSGFPAVLKIHKPKSSSSVRKVRMASSSARAISSGHQFAPAASTFSKLSSATEPGQPTRSRQNAQQRKLRQANRGGAVVNQNDFIASERQLVPSASRCSVTGGQEFETGMRAGILDPIACFVCELAEIHFPGMRGKPKHVDVGPGTKNAVLGAGDDDRTNLRMFKSNALQ